MFKFLKKKLQDGISKLSKDIDEQGEEEITEEVPEVKKKGFLGKIFGKKDSVEEEIKEEIKEEPIEKEVKTKVEEKVEPKVKEPIKEEVKPIVEEEKPEIKKIPKEVKKDIEEVKEEEKVLEPVKEEPKVEETPKVAEIKKEKPEVKEKPVEKVKEEEAKVKEVLEPVKEVSETKSVSDDAQKSSISNKPKPEVKEEKKGFFGAIKQRIVTKKIDESKFEQLFWDLEVALLENNVAVEVIEKIKSDLKINLTNVPLKRGQIENIIINSLKSSVSEILDVESLDFIEKIKEKKPYVVCFIGINGSGKTTSIAKIAYMLKEKGLSVVLAAADTFRAAAIDQLGIHADKLGVKLIKHDYGSDPAAVAFDAISHAKSKGIDVVLIDTAGRMHSNSNLTDEMKKIVKVANPDMKVFVGESITGNDCVEQAKKFDEAVGIDAIILSKADIDEKGGAAVSVSYITKKPIIYIGTGQEYKDLTKFDSSVVMDSLGL